MPEEYYVSPNLNILLNRIVTCIHDEDFVVMKGISVTAGMSSQFSSSLSHPESAIALKPNVYLIASEAKSLYASIPVAYPQAVSLACDFAVNIFETHQLLDYLDVVIPFVVMAGEEIQFGAVYLIENCYPCATQLTRNLLLTDPEQLLEICRWINALANHCNRVKGMLTKLLPQEFNLSKRAKTVIEVSLNVSY